MTEHYDLVVVGTGTAASVAAKRCRAAGWSVAVVDERPFGGTCAQRGCDPKKVLVGVAEAVAAARRLRGKGVSDDGLGISWPDLMAFKRGFTEPVPAQREESFAEQGIACHHGRARLVGATAVAVGDTPLEGRFLLLANGAKPMPLGIAGEEHLATSDDFLDLDALPRRVVLVGGGYIAFEFAHIARHGGAEVTVLEQGSRFLSPFDQDLVGWLVEDAHRLGIALHSDTAVEAVERAGDGFRVRAKSDGQSPTFDADLVVHAAGRVPALVPEELDTAGIDHEKGRPKLNEHLQSRSNPAVYVAGDAAQANPPLTPVASRDGEVVAANMLEGNHRTADYGAVPSVVFTSPPLASVGLREDQARDKGLNFRVSCRQTAGWYASRRLNVKAAGHKILVEEDSGRLLGAHLLGPQADELINLFALAINSGLDADTLRRVPFAYPTAASYLDSMLGE
ncbi:MAG TPA: NAD(P)/FAD-dependent oxidoreductase [Kiloniellaceae bacterium]|nr:NAD(P)/FAD-dependent oxidoreductase [Kiloniellaceae bacterium]